MRQRLFELHIPGREYGDFFIIEQPTFGDDEFYIQSISLSWFVDRELKRAFPNLDGLHKGKNWVEYRKTVKYCSEHVNHRPVNEVLTDLNIDIDTVPVCKGVWDFYDKIGYNRKTKRYVK